MQRLVLFSVVIISMMTLICGQPSNGTNDQFCQDLKDSPIDYTFSFPRVDQFQNYLFIGRKTWKLVFVERTTIETELIQLKQYEPIGTNTSKVETKNFYNQTYRTGFGILGESTAGKVIIGALTLDWKTISYYLVPYYSGDTSDPFDKFGSFETGFNSSDFRPQVSFTSYKRLNDSTVVFIESKTPVNGKYQKRVQVYKISDPTKGWINQTKNNGQSNFRRKRQTESLKVPPSVWSTADQYLIKGVFALRLESNNIYQNFVAILVELCTNNDVPCTGTVDYKYCIVLEEDKDPTSDGKPCHKSNLKSIVDCIPDITETIIESSTSSDTASSTGQADPETGGSLTWLWIVIILVIVLVIIVILVVFLMKNKEKKPEKDLKDGTTGQPIKPTKSGISTSLSKTSRSGFEQKPTDVQIKATESSMSTSSKRSVKKE